MKMDRNEVIRGISKILFSNDEIFEVVKEYLVERFYYSLASVSEWQLIPSTFKKISTADIYCILMALRANDRENEALSLSKVFSQDEIHGINAMIKRDVKLNEGLCILKDASYLAENQWMCKVSVSQLALLIKKEIIWADPELQRQSKIRQGSAGEILREVSVRKKTVVEISDLIANKEFAFNTIRLNLVDDGEAEPLIDEEERTITLPDGGDIVVLDGNHRSTGAADAYAKHENLRDYFGDVYFSVIFTFFNKARAREVVVQEATVQHFAKKQYNAMKNNYANYIVEEMKKNEDAERIYSKKIVNTSQEIKMGGGFIEFGLLATQIEKCYDTKKLLTNKEAKNISQWIVSVFNVIAAMYPGDLVSYKETLSRKWICHKQTWAAFVNVSKWLQDDADWELHLKQVMSSVNWDISAIPFRNNYSNSKQIEIVVELLKTELEEVIQIV